jgi:cardiolipin synthase
MLLWTVALVFTISEWVIRLAMPFVVIRRRRPTSAMAWLMVIFLQPWVGLVLYALIGSNRLVRRRMAHHARLRARLSALHARFDAHPHLVRGEVGPWSDADVALAEQLGQMPVLGNNDVEILCHTDDVIHRLVADIDAAERHVHLLFYIYATDATAGRVTAALERAAGRGVKCRVLVDGVGSRVLLRHQAKAMAGHGIEVREALPVGLFRRRVARIDLRNHRKLAVIDGKTAYSGSQNLIDASYGYRDLEFSDMMVRLTGPAVQELQMVFLEDWYFETEQVLEGQDIFPEPPVAGRIAAQVLPSGPNFPSENYQRMVVASLHAARQHVVITTPYFIPDEAVTQALEVAVLRGVRVDLIISRRSDHSLVCAAGKAYYSQLLELGVNIYLYTQGILHSKTIAFDRTLAFIGSSNFDIRSFTLNFEINMLFYGPEVTARLRLAQEEYLHHSVLLSRQQWDGRPAVRKAVQNLAKLLSPLL